MEHNTSNATMKATTLVDVMAQADALAKSGDSAAAIACYTDWLASPGAEPQLRHLALFNLGSLLRPAGHIEQAIAAYQEALQLRPDFYQAAVNLGLTLEAQGNQAGAMAIWLQALQPVEGQTLLLNHAGRLQEVNRNFDEAEALLGRSLAVMPDQPDVMQHYLHIRQKKCQWPVFDGVAGIPLRTLQQNVGPLGLLASSDDPALQLAAITAWVERKVPRNLPRMAPLDGYRHDKLRIGYLSCDFRWHAVSILTAELLELHDRERFEVYGIDFSPEDGGTMRQRMLAAFDRHLPIHALSDEEAAQTIRRHEIDVLIDLTGLTAGARPGIVAHKPAPVQISYLGYVGSCGMAEIDYILADRYVFPEALVRYYFEKPLYLPEVYQANDSQRPIAETPSRASCGLPDDAFVFCSFNGSYKISEPVFTVWMNILRRVPNGVLWLAIDNPTARGNLAAEAVKRGVDPGRLVFADKAAPSEYLARYRAADLLLDTNPYNAGTTASDALWAGLPVLTCSGKTFASRMAGSLLHAVGLPELITTSWLDYENLAVGLASEPTALQSYRQRLHTQGRSSALFDTRRFVKNFEATIAGLFD